MADTVTTQTIVDTESRLVVKLTNVSDGTGESNVMKVNAAALVGAYWSVPLSNAAARPFKVGETVTCTAGGTGVVMDYDRAANGTHTILYLRNVSGSLPTGNVLTGATSSVTRTISGTAAAADYRLTCSKLVFNVASGLVELIWAGGTPRPIAVLSGTGALRFAAEGAAIPNNAVTPTGNVNLTTHDFITGTANTEFKSGYTIWAEFKKVSGYKSDQLHKNQGIYDQTNITG
jgi:hypothetical protein